MTNSEKRAKAKELWQEYKKSSGLLLYNNRRKAGFIRRIKNVAVHISQSTTNQVEVGALMYLSHLELWLDLDLNHHFKD